MNNNIKKLIEQYINEEHIKLMNKFNGSNFLSKLQKLFSITALTQDREWILKLCMAFLNSYGYVEMSWYKDGFSEAERVLMKRSE